MVSKRVESLLNQLRTQGIVDERVLEAIALVPREKFVDEAFEHKAWKTPRCRLARQTISQPYMVARMTELLTLTPESRVLRSAPVPATRRPSRRIWCITYAR